MLQHYLTLALRHLKRQPGYTVINVTGLAVAVACAVLALLFVRHETSFDQFHENSDRLYRAWGHEDYGEDQQYTWSNTPVLLGPTLAENFSDVEAIVRVEIFTDLVRREGTAFEEPLHLVDPAFLDVFSFEWLRGDAATALAQPNSIVLTPALAQKYFGEEDPLGQALEVRVNDAYQTFTVTGLIAPPPRASSIQYQALVPYLPMVQQIRSERAQTSWFNIFAETYVLLKPGVEAASLQAQFVPLMQRLLGDQYPPNGYFIRLQPMPEIHLDQSVPDGFVPASDPAYSYILGAIALLLLVVASVNFVTLAVGRSAVRAKEVGVRKAVGAQRGQLMQQFWGEALVTTVLSLLLGLGLARLALPLFNQLAGMSLVLTLDVGLLLLFVVLALLVGFGAGSYPAAVLSNFRPVEVLKGKISVRSDQSLLRRGLVVLQFALAIVMIVGTLVMARQLHFLQTKNLGFDQEQVVVVPTTGSVAEGRRVADLFVAEVEGQPRVAAVTSAFFPPGDPGFQIGYTDDKGAYRNFNINVVRPGFIEAMGMEMVAGRAFSRDNPADATRGVIVNEAFVREYGWTDPLVQRIPGANFPDHEIIGVVKDFHYQSLRDEVVPLALVLEFDVLRPGISDLLISSSPAPDLLVRLRAGNVPAALVALEQTWGQILPGEAFEYRFLDDELDAQYAQEQRLGQIVQIASMLAIFIACLGLFGLATLMVARRTKEVGIRKVLGASVPGLVGLLSKDFAVLVGVAFLVAAPAAYFLMQRWLEGFAYRIALGPELFLLAGALALLIALLTVSYHAFRAARANPVEALRYE